MRDGVRVFWERYGDGSPTILLMPTWSIVHSRHWKLQIPYLARHFRVVTFDGRGNGRSDRPTEIAAYADTEFVADAIAVHGRDRHRPGGRRGAVDGRRVRGAARGRAPGARASACACSARPSRSTDRKPSDPDVGPDADFDELAARRRGLAQVQRPLLAPRLAGLRGLVLRRGAVHRAAFDQAGRGRRRLVPRDRSRDDDRRGTRAVPRAAGGLGAPAGWRATGRAFLRRVRVSGPRRPRHRRPHHVDRHRAAGRGGARRHVRRDRGRRPLPHRARARPRQPADPRLRASAWSHGRDDRRSVPAPADVAFDRDSGRARLPDRSGFAVADDGVRLAFDVYGAGDPTHRAAPVGADRPLPPVEGPGPLPQPPLARGHLRRPGQRPLGSAARSRSPTSTSGWSATSRS